VDVVNSVQRPGVRGRRAVKLDFSSDHGSDLVVARASACRVETRLDAIAPRS